MSSREFIEDERISIKGAILQLGNFIRFLFSKWRVIGLGTAVFALLFVTYQQVKKPSYTARTSFVLEVGSDASSGVSSLASMVGISVGDIGGANQLFNADNILELYKSYRMLKQTFLQTVNIDGDEERLITRFLNDSGTLQKWRKKQALADFSFEIPIDQMEVVHDSLLMEVIEDFREKSLVVDRIDRRLSILQVRVDSKDQLFAKVFNEQLVENVNSFYLETKTKKSATNLAVLNYQADSVKTALDDALARFGRASEGIPNPNPILATNMINYQKLGIDIQTTTAVYEEILKQLEIAKISHLKSMPLIQIIDEPVLPLENDKNSFLKSVVLGLFFGGLLMVIYFTVREVYNRLMAD